MNGSYGPRLAEVQILAIRLSRYNPAGQRRCRVSAGHRLIAIIRRFRPAASPRALAHATKVGGRTAGDQFMRLLALALTCVEVAGVAMADETPKSFAGGPGSLEGIWSGASFSELQRPDELKALVLTSQQAVEWENKLKPSGGVNIGADPLGQAQSEFPEAGDGLMRVGGQIRSSLIVEPADGKLPLTVVAKAALGKEPERPRDFDNVESRPQEERCLTAGPAGAPSIPEADANVVQIVEAPGYVVIVSERYHDARIIALDRARNPRSPASWLGDSIGRWDGATLVVETSNYRPGLTERGGGLVVTPQTIIVERFTRISAARVHYSFSVTDPSMFTQTWRGEYELVPSSPMFEYACHEGNYAISHILRAARLGRQDAPVVTPARPAKP